MGFSKRFLHDTRPRRKPLRAPPCPNEVRRAGLPPSLRPTAGLGLSLPICFATPPEEDSPRYSESGGLERRLEQHVGAAGLSGGLERRLEQHVGAAGLTSAGLRRLQVTHDSISKFL